MSPFVQMYLYGLIPATVTIIGCVALMWKASGKYLDAHFADERGRTVIVAAACVIGIVVVALLLGGIAAGEASLDAIRPECA